VLLEALAHRVERLGVGGGHLLLQVAVGKRVCRAPAKRGTEAADNSSEATAE
jgi:hypothetical protein